MLSANRISKSYGDVIVLKDVSFIINPHDRIGLIGPNGCGKTTLLHILTSELAADMGEVQRAPHLRVGYLAQQRVFPAQATLQDGLDATLGNLAQAEAEVERLAVRLAAEPSTPALAERYDTALTALQTIAAVDLGQAQTTLRQLGLGELPPETLLATLSGGQKTRLALALTLLAQPQLLLLDEPTNHLDLEMLEWLEDWLVDFPGAVLAVSHDRAFLDHTTTTILELDPAEHTARAFPGNYSDYLENKLAERERQWGAWRDQEAEVTRMRRDIARTKEHSLSVERSTTPRQPNVRRLAKKVARKALSREKKLDRYLAADERVEKPKADWQMKLAFEQHNPSGRDVLVIENASIGYERPLLTNMSLTLRYGARVALIGSNGAGKTTLARTIAGQLPPLAGRVRLGSNVRLGYFAQEQELLRPELNALSTLQRFSAQSDTELRNFLHYFLFKDDMVFTPIAELSYGERARLALATLVAQGCNFLVLDEPLNHLDIPSRTRFEQALAEFDGTVLAIVHDRYFIERFANELWTMAEGEMRITR